MRKKRIRQLSAEQNESPHPEYGENPGTLFADVLVVRCSPSGAELRLTNRYNDRMTNQPPKNFAFIDAQNLYLGLKDIGITLDFRRFRIYLRDRLQVTEAYYFLGYMPELQALYANLQRAGFVLQFKEVTRGRDGKAKGNVDVDLTLRVVDKIADTTKP